MSGGFGIPGAGEPTAAEAATLEEKLTRGETLCRLESLKLLSFRSGISYLLLHCWWNEVVGDPTVPDFWERRQAVWKELLEKHGVPCGW